MKAIGGFFELELPATSNSYHPDAVALSTGRACLRVILQHLEIKKCYVPFYTCNAVFEPFHIENIEMETYGLNENLGPDYLPDLNENEYFFYINYFGIKSTTTDHLISKYGKNLIIDNTHLFFRKGYKSNWSFTSARKYFGVPDGAYLYSPGAKLNLVLKKFTGISVQHNVSRLAGLQSQSYKEYQEYEKTLNSDIHAISLVSERLLGIVDYNFVKDARIQNFNFIHQILQHKNQLQIEINNDVPFAYPFLPSSIIDKNIFYKENIFIPSLWIDPFYKKDEGFEFDKKLALQLLPVPIDHRYNENDMKNIADLILKNIE